jgi:cysteine desulfurase/selenocysteine lyase
MTHSSRLQCADDFGPFDGRIWLNAAGQGPLPHPAIRAAEEALAWKVAPYRVPENAFREVPHRLKRALGQLIGVPPEDIILGNSTTYGIHLLANGLPWREGDEVLLIDGDFPASVLSWLLLRERGVTVRLLRPENGALQADELAVHLSPATRVFCASWVNSFNGYAIDLQALGEVCRANDVLFFVNGTQAFGTRPLAVSEMPVDAVTCCGYKWLCGPFSTGFCWLKPDLRQTLNYKQVYWLNNMRGDDFNQVLNYDLRDDLGAAAYDVFATANYFSFLPWAASVEYLLGKEIAEIARHNTALVARLIDGLDPDKYAVQSPREGPARSTLLVVTHRQPERNAALFQALKQAGIDLAMREGNLRFSPHLYNSDDDIDRALAILNAA